MSTENIKLYIQNHKIYYKIFKTIKIKSLQNQAFTKNRDSAHISYRFDKDSCQGSNFLSFL